MSRRGQVGCFRVQSIEIIKIYKVELRNEKGMNIKDRKRERSRYKMKK